MSGPAGRVSALQGTVSRNCSGIPAHKLIRFPLAVAVIALLGLPGPALASKRCGTRVTGGRYAKVLVARGSVSCVTARGVARAYYRKIRTGAPFDGRLPDGSIYFLAGGFRCSTGLGGSQGFCASGRRRIFMSVRIGDGWPY